MSRKSTIDALFGAKSGDLLGAPNNATLPQSPPAVRTGAVAAMGASLQQWQAAQKNSEDLAAQVAAAKSVIEIEPSAIDPAPVRDRLTIEHDPSLDALVTSIRESGQQVPVLVRPHPALPGRFQTAYGHRRIEAARRLGIRVRAVVAALDDDALVTAQGKENSERRDLTFIEKALFARRLDEARYDRALICAALSTDKSDVSRAIAVARSMPDGVIEAIGPAPKAGRARWLALAEALKGSKERKRAESLIETDAFRALHSDQRFLALMERVTKPAKPAPAVISQSLVLDGNGRPVVDWRQGEKTQTITFDEIAAPGFAAFIAADLPAIYDRFMRQAALASRGQSD